MAAGGFGDVLCGFHPFFGFGFFFCKVEGFVKSFWACGGGFDAFLIRSPNVWVIYLPILGLVFYYSRSLVLAWKRQLCRKIP